MNWSIESRQRRLSLERYLGEMLFLHGLGELIPRKQRGPVASRFAWVVLFLAVLGWVGLPAYGGLVSLGLALALETLDAYRQRRGLLSRVFLGRGWRERIGPPFYWALVVGSGLVSLLHTDASLSEALFRAGFQWICFKTIEDLTHQPQRYESVHHFLSWLERLWQQVIYAFRTWVKFAFVGAMLAVILNLSSARIWESVGQTPWSRLFAFGGGLYVMAVWTFNRLSQAMVRSSVEAAVESWDGIRPSDLKRMLRSVPSLPGVVYAGASTAKLLEMRAGWKSEYSLLSRVGQQLTAALARRQRQNVLSCSLLAIILAACMITVSTFLLIPRDVIARWVSAGQTADSGVVLAVNRLAELGSGEFWNQALGPDGVDLGQEPLPKLAFLEAVIIMSLIMFEASSSHLRADLDPSAVRRWLALGTTYLILLENEFQHLYSGFLTRQLTGAGALRHASIQNDVLLIPAVGRKAPIYRAIADYLQIYGLPEEDEFPFAITLFDNLHSAQEWALRFLRFTPAVMARPPDLDRRDFWEPEAGPVCYWIWSDNELVMLSSFEEARWYARLVAFNHSNHSEKGQGRP